MDAKIPLKRDSESLSLHPLTPDMKDLRNVSSSWDSLAQSDAMGAVLTGKEWNESEFYASGERQVEVILKLLESQGISLATNAALDFGCGLGRLSFALCKRFESVTGIDISKEMIKRATSSPLNPENLKLIQSERNDLRFIEENSQDFVLSLIVLQHIPTRIAKAYIGEFLRVTKPGGIIVFQAITKVTGLKKSTQQSFWEGKPLNWDSPSLPKLIYRATCRFARWIPRKIVSHRLACYLKKRSGAPIMQMNPISLRSLSKTINAHGGTLLLSVEDGAAGSDFESRTFIVRKR
ncbi:class I SAM-dependent methyltransferase [Pelagicoccus sp. NFK12]|uniref:Class I SAM-dependent methyltransferase n=1 Tax=Pelagicoccus enzymogenes TaxID=2773457 RepID=A0A927IJ06_9BACT|nr:class I SAM-dependent methyltransferase [Pelagicoccus enzymogenes]MBD5781379.1 class I SAM-dependent methyltransferase [Pelagicoccus enzymogenes]